MKSNLRIAFFYPSSSIRLPIDVNNIWTSDRGLTGSEIACVMYALELSRRGHGVTLFTKITRGADLERITCCHYDEWRSIYKDQEWDALCSWMTPEPLEVANPNQFRFFNQQVSDFKLCKPGWESYVDILAPLSHSHAHYMKSMSGFSSDKWRVLYNGVDINKFKPDEKIPGKMIWASSHDRGLHWLLEAFPKIKKAVPHATLHIFYDFNGVENFARMGNHDNSETGKIFAELGQRARYILDAIRRLKDKGVFAHRSVSRERICSEMASSEVLAYPCDPVHYTETFGVTVLEACASGTVPILCTADAFDELWGSIGDHVPPPYFQHKDAYIEKVIHALTDKEYLKSESQRCVEYAKKFEWPVLAKDLEQCLVTRGDSGLPKTW